MLLLVTILVPQVVSAAWWNPLSWFDSWNFHKNDTETHILENRIQELEKKLESESKTTQEVVAPTVNESHGTSIPTSKIVQPIKPTPTMPKDFTAQCNLSKNEMFNGDSVKAEIYIPFDDISNYEIKWDKKYLTNQIDNNKAVFSIHDVGQKNILVSVVRKVDAYNKDIGCPILVKKEAESISVPAIEEDWCAESKSKAVSIAQQKEAALTEHNVKLSQIQQNSGGTFGGVLETEIQNENDRYQGVMNALDAQLTTTNYQIIQYCE